MTRPGLTRAAGEFAAAVRYEHLPIAAVQTVRLGFHDTCAALLAGSCEPVVERLRSYAGKHRPGGEVRLLSGGGYGTAESAALIDATAAHALDFDDYAFSNHPSAVLVPAIHACANLSGAGGRKMVAAYCAGYEIWGDLMRREPDHLHGKGWHPTAVLGPVGAAAASAHVLGLNAETTTHAIALAASHSGGLMGNFGSMAKALHAGLAAEAGVRSACLAASGISGRDNALESDTGLLAALSPRGNWDQQTEPAFGKSWLITKLALNIKKYPTVGASQRCIDSILRFVAGTPVVAKDVASIRAHVSERHAKVMPFDDPKTPAEARFSLHFACAAAIHFGKVGLAEVSHAGLADPGLRKLMGRVTVIGGDDYDPGYPGAAPKDFVELQLDDGRTLSTPPIRRATGHADNPLGRDEALGKLLDCAAQAGIGEDRARRLSSTLWRIEEAESARALDPWG